MQSRTSAIAESAVGQATPGIYQCGPPHRLQRVNDWAQIPFGKKAGYLFLDPLQAPFRIRPASRRLFLRNIFVRQLVFDCPRMTR
jgi:hypothetical protein